MNGPNEHTSFEVNGNLSRLRNIVALQEPALIQGLEVEPAMAGHILAAYEAMPPHMQELLAMDCNADFVSCYTKFAVLEAFQAQVHVVLGDA